jgi:hypothetical protein
MGEMSYHYVVANDCGECLDGMHHRTILDGCSLTNHDGPVVSSQDSRGPNRRVRTNGYVTDNSGVGVYKSVWMD